MLENTVFSLADGTIQAVAFVGFAVATIAFCVWLIYLVRE